MIAEVRDGLASCITVATGLRVMPYYSSSIPHPCAQIQSLEYDPRMVLGRAAVQLDFRVSVYVGPASERSAQIRCDTLREPSGSIVDAVESLPEYAAGVSYGAVTRIGEVREVIVAEEVIMMFEIDVEVVF